MWQKLREHWPEPWAPEICRRRPWRYWRARCSSAGAVRRDKQRQMQHAGREVAKGAPPPKGALLKRNPLLTADGAAA